MEIRQIGDCTLYYADCLEVLPTLKTESIHSVIVDLPYGTTYCAWDFPIPPELLWIQYKRIIIGNGALVFTCHQPYTTTLIQSNMNWYRHEWIWDKEYHTNFANCKRQPLKVHENVIVFSNGQPPYYPIKVKGEPNPLQKTFRDNQSESRLISKRVQDDLSGMKYPTSILKFPKHSSQCGLHPTQKPLDLMSYLVKTYTKKGEVVLDNTMGSATTGVACMDAERSFIGIENDRKHFDIACIRLEATLKRKLEKEGINHG